MAELHHCNFKFCVYRGFCYSYCDRDNINLSNLFQMTKSEILEVVKMMQKDWQLAIDGNTIAIDNCNTGFCKWVCACVLRNMEDYYLLKELQKDLEDKHISKNIYWYNTYINIGIQALIPRLNHLNRTIARLKNELKAQQNG